MKAKRFIAFLLVFLLTFDLSSRIAVKAVTSSTNKENYELAKEEEKRDGEIPEKMCLKEVVSLGDEILISWDSVEQASLYQIKINDEIYNTNDTFIRITPTLNKIYTYQVRYKKDDSYSFWSDEKQYLNSSDSQVTRNNFNILSTENDAIKILGSVYGNRNGQVDWYSLNDDGNGVTSVLLDGDMQIIKLNCEGTSAIQLKYRVYIEENKSWSSWVNSGEEAGEQNKTITSIQIQYNGDKIGLIEYNTINNKGEISPTYNNGESDLEQKNFAPIKGIKISVDNKYTILNEDEVWQKDSTKNIEGTLEIPIGKTLEIEEGTIINFLNEGSRKTRIIVKGNLIIKGSSNKYVKLLAGDRNLSIDVRYTGSIDIQYADITAKGSNDNFINVLGNANISNCKFNNIGEKSKVNAIVLNQSRYNTENNKISINYNSIENFDNGIVVYATQDAIDLIGNNIENSNKGINLINKSYTANKNIIDIYGNQINNNTIAINIEQKTMEKTKSYKDIEINKNTITNSILEGISLKIDGIKNISIKNNTIDGTNKDKNQKDLDSKELVGGPINVVNLRKNRKFNKKHLTIEEKFAALL